MTDYVVALREYCDFFEELSPQCLSQIEDRFTKHAHFKDPFNDVHGHQAIRRVFEHMYEQLHEAKFVVKDSAINGRVAYIEWCFRYQTGPRAIHQEIVGLSRVEFDDLGLVKSHIDYWDPAEQLYDSIPILGGLLRLIRRKLAAS